MMYAEVGLKKKISKTTLTLHPCIKVKLIGKDDWQFISLATNKINYCQTQNHNLYYPKWQFLLEYPILLFWCLSTVKPMRGSVFWPVNALLRSSCGYPSDMFRSRFTCAPCLGLCSVPGNYSGSHQRSTRVMQIWELARH